MVFMDGQRLCESGDVQIPHTSPYDYSHDYGVAETDQGG